MVFTIKQNATLPILRMELFQDGKNDYKRYMDNISNSVITFSMKDSKTGIYKVANKAGTLYQKEPCIVDGTPEYYIGYQFTTTDTDCPGIYQAEFKLHVLDLTSNVIGELITPFGEDLYVHIIDSFIKSEVVYN